jgi:hypothetical protein
MDANVLRAAVSAAIRVTVSTTLIGCGANVTSETITPNSGGTAAGVGGTPVAQVPESTPSSMASTGGGVAVSGGAAPELGGAASGDGGAAIGGEASAGAPSEVCGAVAQACLTVLQSVAPGAALDEAQLACCPTVLQEIRDLTTARAECRWMIQSAFLSSPAHRQCCEAQDAWNESACTPWGPPVPPELPARFLEAWELAA